MWMTTPMAKAGLVIAASMVLGAVASGDDTACPAGGEGACSSQGASMMQKLTAAKSREEAKSWLVRYNNINGKLAAEAVDVGGNSFDLRHLHTMVIVATDTAAFALRENPDIAEVDEDKMDVHVLVHHRGEEIVGLGRVEETPYGIDMVEIKDVPVPDGTDLIKVCVVDTGYGLNHPDLPTRNDMSIEGTKQGSMSGSWDVDGHGHGSHCAGTIGAIGGNEKGVVGVLADPSKFSFHIGKGLSDSGSGTYSNVLYAVEGCIEAGAKIISMSLGGGWTQAAEDAYKDAYMNDGVLIIAAAGNGGDSDYSYPASYPHVMSVGAVDSNRNIASFSQYNDQVEISAPGVGVKSTITTNNGAVFSYAAWSGTSMATPHVAGVAARIWSLFPTCTNEQIRNVLLITASDRGDAGCDDTYGFGIVNAKAAYHLLLQDGCDAGGNTTVPVGGCLQKPGATTPAPTTPPTCHDTCNSRSFLLELTTDNYPAETEWTLRKKSGEVVETGSGYKTAGKTYEKKLCLTEEEHEFEITDSYGDGMCCSYGSGSYTVTVNDVVVKTGGQYGESETTAIDECTQSTSVSPTLPASTPEPNTTVTMHQLLDGCTRSNKGIFEIYGEVRMEYDNISAGETICCNTTSGKATRKINGQCTGKGNGKSMKTYTEALEICAGAGMGLCSSQAVIDTTCGKGCTYNRALVWTSISSE